MTKRTKAACSKRHKKERTKEDLINNKLIIRNCIISISIIGILILLNVFMYNSENYKKFTEVGTLGVLWTIIGFAFTIYCFIIPKLSKTINLMNRLEKSFGTVNYYDILGEKGYFTIKRNEYLLQLLKGFLFASLGFLCTLTFTTLGVVNYIKAMQIFINIASTLIITFSASTYIILILLAQHSFDATNGIDDETLEKLKFSVNTLEKWDNEAKLENLEYQKGEKKNGKDENAK